MYHVYILECSDGTYYTGIAKDPVRRAEEHNSSPRGAKYTRARRPVVLVYTSGKLSRSAAAREERRIKRLPRSEKAKLAGRHS